MHRPPTRAPQAAVGPDRRDGGAPPVRSTCNRVCPGSPFGVPVLVVGGLRRRRAMAQNDPSRGLAREAIGLREVLFQSITHMAPAAAVAFSIIVGANFAAGALPLS